MATRPGMNYRQQTPAQEIERERELDVVQRREAAKAANGGRSAPHSAAETAGGISTPAQWAARNTPSPNFLGLKPLGGPPLPMPGQVQQPLGTPNPASPILSHVDPYATGISNPPPMNNVIPGSAATASLSQPHQVHAAPLPAPLTGPVGNAETDRADYEQNRALYAPGGMIAHSQPPPQTVFQPNIHDSEAILSQYQTTNPNGTPKLQATFKPGTVTDAGGNVTSNGVPFNQQTARASLYASHPEIFQANTPENAAFVSHAQQYGEPSAHANIDTILGGAKPAGTSTPAVGDNSDPSATPKPPNPQLAASTVTNRVSPY